MLRGRVALVTGAAGGIGRALVHLLREHGARVVGVDLHAPEGADLALQADVTRADDVRRMVGAAVEAFGHLDLAVNNAGVSHERQRLQDLDADEFDRVVAVNLRGVFLCLREEIPVMRDRPGAAIVNVASVSGVKGSRGLAGYVASKHGVVGLTRTAALENADSGLRVNAVCPGLVDTALIGDLSPEKRVLADRMHPLGRIATPEEVGHAVLWLLGPHASFVTGAALPVDGGYTL